MKVATSLADADVSHPSVVSIGNFDGLHIGHREILKTVVERARQLKLRPVAMTFSPHPIRFLSPDRAPRLISTLNQKIRLIESTGIDVLFLANFDEAFSRLEPEDFIKRYLIDGLHARSICVGISNRNEAKAFEKPTLALPLSEVGPLPNVNSPRGPAVVCWISFR